MINKTVLLIGHEKSFTASIVDHLQNRGYCVVTGYNKAAALEQIVQSQSDIVLIHEDFFDAGFLESIKTLGTESKRIPIILIVPDPPKANPVSAFHQNVNDCVHQEIHATLLVQRMQRSLTTLAPNKPKIPLGSTLFLPCDFQILCGNEERITLLPKENELLLLLCNKHGEICTKEEIIQVLWGQKKMAQHHPKEHWHPNLDVLISRLRVKLKRINVHIENIKKVGYRLQM